jgi:hypothetical protein
MSITPVTLFLVIKLWAQRYIKYVFSSYQNFLFQLVIPLKAHFTLCITTTINIQATPQISVKRMVMMYMCFPLTVNPMDLNAGQRGQINNVAPWKQMVVHP